MLFSKDKSKAAPNGKKIAECTKCSAPIGDLHPYKWCSECGEALSEQILELIPSYVKKREADEEAAQLAKEGITRNEYFEAELRKILLTTAHSLEGYRVLQTLEVITAETVVGLNLLKSIFLGIESEFISGEDHSTNKLLKTAREKCLHELRKEAHSLGANAVIAIDLTYTELPFGGKNMLLLVASGTAVQTQLIA